MLDGVMPWRRSCQHPMPSNEANNKTNSSANKDIFYLFFSITVFSRPLSVFCFRFFDFSIFLFFYPSISIATKKGKGKEKEKERKHTCRRRQQRHHPL